MVVLLIYLFLILAVAAVLMGLLSSTSVSPSQIQMLQQEGISQRKDVYASQYLAKIFPFTRPLLEKLKLDKRIKDRLDAGHIKLAFQEFFNLKILLAIVLGITVFFVYGKLNLFVLCGVLIFAYIGPEIWLSSMIAKRKDAIVRVLPETVDLLGLCVEAGLSFTAAIKWLIDKKITQNPMIEELAFVAEEIKWGKPRAQALKDMSKRLKIMEVSSFVQTLVQAERMGSPVSEAFSILSEDSRLQRFNRGERFALKAPIKILIPLIFCILPVIGIIIGGPILLQFMKGGLTAGMTP